MKEESGCILFSRNHQLECIAMPIINKYTVSAPNSQFYLEPKTVSLDEAYFEDERDSAQEFSAFRNHAAIGTPPNTYHCFTEIEVSEKATIDSASEQVYSFPLSVDKDNDLYIRSLDDLGDSYPISIPAGRYDVLVQFFDCVPGDAMNNWHVRISFLPPDTLGPSCVRLVDQECPVSVFVHEEERGSDSF